jgi:asparagine synthase (glutamine-hydrolysing)
MSGICGVINRDGAPVDPETLRRMAQAAAHRGPDGVRFHTDGAVGLVHLALNLTPESLNERQPLTSGGGDLVLTADARIDNREELIRALTAKGCLKGDAPTDAELILAAYRYWGTGCPARLVGDFAFAIWDAKRGRLFAARDPMGMRAFYYRIEPRRALFGTEAKQILAAPGVPVRLFEPAIGAHLVADSGSLEWSFYEGVSQLAPAHALVVAKSGHRAWRYWDIDPEYRIEYSTEEQYVEHFWEIFSEAVRCRLRSARPVGIFLSGGVDSGSAASTAGWLLRRGERGLATSFHTYTFAFEELPQCDERHISDRVVRRYGFPHHYTLAETAYPLSDYPARGPDKDEPFIGVYQATYEQALAAAKSEGIGLMLSCDCGDAMVGGRFYDYLGLLTAGRWRSLWNELQAYSRSAGIPLQAVVRSYLLTLPSLWPDKRAEALLMRLRRALGRPPVRQPYPSWVRPEFAELVGLTKIAEHSEPRTNIKDSARRQRYYAAFWPMDLRSTVWIERSRARFGLGFADPWSDRRLAEFVLATPQWVLNLPSETKRIARRAMRGVMPEKARREAGKVFFGPLHERAIKEYAKDTVLDLITNSQAAARGYVDEDVLHDQYGAVRRGERGLYGLWETLTLEMWLRRYWS